MCAQIHPLRIGNTRDGRIAILCPDRPDVNELIKSVEGWRWHPERYYSLPPTPEARIVVRSLLLRIAGSDEGQNQSVGQSAEDPARPATDRIASTTVPHSAATAHSSSADIARPAHPARQRIVDVGNPRKKQKGDRDLVVRSAEAQPPDRDPEPAARSAEMQSSADRDPILNRMSEELALRRYSQRTRRVYLHQIRQLLRHAGVAAQDLEDFHVRNFLLHRANATTSAAYHAQAVTAVRFLFRTVLARPDVVRNLPRPKRD